MASHFIHILRIEKEDHICNQDPDEEEIESYDETELYELLSSHPFYADFIYSEDRVDPKEALKNFVKVFGDHGEVVHKEGSDTIEILDPAAYTLKALIRDFEEFKEASTRLTLADFAGSGIWDISQMLNKAKDAFIIEGEAYTYNCMLRSLFSKENDCLKIRHVKTYLYHF